MIEHNIYYCPSCSNSLSKINSTDNIDIFICSFCGDVIYRDGEEFKYGGKTSGSASARSLIDILKEYP